MAQSSGILGSLADSPKKQRRLMIVSALVFAVGVIAFVSMFFLRGTSNAFTDTFSNQPAQLSRPEKKVPISKRQIAIAREFIKTAVARRNLDKAWNIVDVDLRGRMSKKQWLTGDIPVIYYDSINADRAAFVVDYSYETSALMEVDLIPKPGTQKRPHLLFYLGLKRERGKKNGRWLVDYWQPNWRPPIPAAVG